MYWLLAVLLALFCIPSRASDFSGKVIAVSDGDTVTVLHSGITTKIRLADIDCPEKKQDFGQAAKQFTSQLAFNKEVHIIDKGKDRYARTIGEVILPDGSSLNKELVKAGYAWQYKKYSHDQTFQILERQAKVNKQGLWSATYLQAPWDFRKHHHHTKAR